MTPSGNGISQPQNSSTEFTFLSGLYFSVVTVSSLGYGDMQPVGYSRAAATIEVLFGLGFIGIMIAKLTSRPILHLVSRVFVSATQNRLSEFSDTFHSHAKRLWSCVSDSAHLYPNIPRPAEPSQEGRARLIDEFRNVVSELTSTSLELKTFVIAEAKESVFFRLVPTLNLLKLAVSIEDALRALGQFVTSLPSRSYPQVFDDILNPTNMQEVTKTKEIVNNICKEFTRENRYGESAVSSFLRVKTLCDTIPDISDIPPQFNPPDQFVRNEDDLPTDD